MKEAEFEDSGEVSSICLAEVSGVSKLLKGRSPGVDEIHPATLKALDIVGLLAVLADMFQLAPFDLKEQRLYSEFRLSENLLLSNILTLNCAYFS